MSNPTTWDEPANVAELAERLAMLSRGQRRAFELIRNHQGAKVSLQTASILYDYGLIERYEHPSANKSLVIESGYFVNMLVSIKLHEFGKKRSIIERNAQSLRS